VNYFKEPSIGGLTEAAGAKLVSFYWGGAMVGRFIGTVTLRMWKPGKVLALHAIGAVLLIAITMGTTGSTAMYTILAVGLFNSIMFPTIFTLAIDGLGKHTGQGSGILCMAIVGGALLPVLQGAVADAIGIHHAFIVALLCYVYIAWYGAKGSTPVAQKA
jgi:FHS family L-fucose permease-like MFS transporter